MQETILLAVLIAIVVVIFAILYKNMNLDKNNVNAPSLEHFENEVAVMAGNENENLQEEHDELKKYMKIHGMYPMNKGIDMSKYVLKSTVERTQQKPDMSQYILKSSCPRQKECPVINRDEWIRKSELPPNWNKQCPEQPDLTNYVLKTTIPPTQKCPPCVCPKVKINAGLCREPNKDDCVKAGVLEDACPKPKPCPTPQCPPQKECPKIEPPPPCPRPPPVKCPEPKCAPCPQCPKEGKCPEPTRCPPAQDCPKCYDVKYLKVPVVKSEPIKKPEQESIFPADLIKTKIIRQQAPEVPRQPRIVSLDDGNNDDDENLLPQLVRPNDYNEIAPAPSIINSNTRNTLRAAPVPKALDVVNNISELNNNKNNKNKNNKYEGLLQQIKNLKNIIKTQESKNNSDSSNNGNNNSLNNKKGGQCGKAEYNKAFDKYGVRGFNNVL